MRHAIAIIGGGFCGTMVAVHLLRQRQTPVQVILLNEGYPTGKGIAYAAHSEVFLLNVHAGRMSALLDQPHHFVDWLLTQPAYAHQDPTELATAFVPRQVYGRYLSELLEETLSNPAAGNSYQVITDRVVDLHQTSSPDLSFTHTLRSGETLVTEQVVLALGNFLPASLPGISGNAPHYFGNPWRPEAWQNLPARAHLLLIGTGLTSIDIILDLLSQDFDGTITAISTNGYLPFPYHTATPDPAFSQELEKAGSLAEILQAFRRAVKERPSGSWEHLINALRGQTQELWRRLSLKDKLRFSKRLGSLWAVARHRLPPQVHAKIQEAIQAGQLEVVAGRIKTLTETPPVVQVEVATPWGLQLLIADRVINCTGPQLHYGKASDALVQSLVAQRLITPHPLRMGLSADAHFNVLRPDGTPTPGLYALGAALRGELWESNAVPELKEQAQTLARHLVSAF